MDSSVTAAWAHLQRGDALEALAELDPTSGTQLCAEGWHARAVSLERLGRMEEALNACQNALAISGEHVGSLVTTGAVHAARGERMASLSAFRAARQQQPERSALAHLVASVGGSDFSAPHRAEVEELFDAYAPRFDAHLLGQLGYRGHVVLASEVRAALGSTKSRRVLDLGCGTGLSGTELRDVASCLVGVDLSTEMLRRAAQRATYDALVAADLVYVLVCWRDGTLDVAVSADTLGYIGALDPIFEECARVLVPGGLLAFTIESGQKVDTFEMGPSRRCRYGEGYVLELAAAHRFDIVHWSRQVLRQEAGLDVPSFVAVFRNGPAGSEAD